MIFASLVVQYVPRARSRIGESQGAPGTMVTKTPATIEDLYQVPDHGKAEIVYGEVVTMSPTGFLPGRAGGEIYASLRQYERQTKRGYAIPDNVGFTVNLPNRASFSPD